MRVKIASCLLALCLVTTLAPSSVQAGNWFSGWFGGNSCNNCCAENDCGSCYTCYQPKTCYNTYCVKEPYCVRKKCYYYEPKYYEKKCCHYVPQYYTQKYCYNVKKYFYTTETRYRTRKVCEKQTCYQPYKPCAPATRENGSSESSGSVKMVGSHQDHRDQDSGRE